MTIGTIGKKLGMTRVFTEQGDSIPVTVIQVLPNIVTQLKTLENDGYTAVQITTGTRRKTRVTKAAAGHFAKANTEAGSNLWEFRVSEAELANFTVGAQINVEMFKDIKMVDVLGSTKGRGFAGVIKRWDFRMQDASHGNSRSHRVPGSIGQNQSPGRVFKGKKMPGHLGNEQITVQNLEVVRVDCERNLLLVKGGVPGASKGDLVITPAVKTKKAA